MKTACEVVVKIGGAAIQLTAETLLSVNSSKAQGLPGHRPGAGAVLEVDIAPSVGNGERRTFCGGANCGRWVIPRRLPHVGPKTRRGRLQQSLNPYSIDTVLRIINTLLPPRRAGFLLHARAESEMGAHLVQRAFRSREDNLSEAGAAGFIC